MTTAALPAHLDSLICRSFLRAAGTPILSAERKAALRQQYRRHLCVAVTARTTGVFTKIAGNIPLLKPEIVQALLPFYRWQLAIASLSTNTIMDAFARIGLCIRTKQRQGTLRRLRAEEAARMRVRAS